VGWYLLGSWVISVPKFSLHWVCFFCSGAGTRNEDDNETESVPLMADGYVFGFCLFFDLISILTFRNNTVHCGFSTFAHSFFKDDLTNGVCISCVSKRQPLKANL
jgi:hypothetical protein